MLKRVLFQLIAKRYLAYRGRIDAETLRKETVQLLQKFLDKVESLSPDQLDAHPIQGKWGGTEVAFHAVNTAKHIFLFCVDLRNGKTLPDVGRSAVGLTKNVSREDLVHLCRQTREQAGQFDFSYVQTASFGHPLFGPMGFKQWLILNLVHLERHYQQLLRVAERL